MNRVLLGFEVGTGEPVNIPLHHTIVTGTTQLSGKTTTLEGLISRSDNYKAIAFRTKRGESGFNEGEPHTPFFKERADWQYVQSLLEATMRERLKFERSWIIRATKNTHDLEGVYNNVCIELKKARGLSESVYTNLKAYLDIVLPQIHSIEFASALRLKAGLNVMDLVGMSEEVQGLVIASTLEAIHKKEKKTISVVPEAWKFVPQGRNTPVHVVIESLAREGAAIGNYVWMDSQDITGVDKGVLKNFDVWILGRQREVNEVERALKQIPMPAKAKPKAEEVAMLALGEFFACYGNQVKKVYVLPAWLPMEIGQGVAVGRQDAIGEIDNFRPQPKGEPDEMSYDQRLAELERENKRLNNENRELMEKLRTDQRTPTNDEVARPVTSKTVHVGPVSIDAVEREVSVTFSRELLQLTTTNPPGRVIFVLATDLKNTPTGEGDIADAMREHGWNYGHSTMAPTLSKLVGSGYLISSRQRPALYRIPGKIKLIIDGKMK